MRYRREGSRRIASCCTEFLAAATGAANTQLVTVAGFLCSRIIGPGSGHSGSHREKACRAGSTPRGLLEVGVVRRHKTAPTLDAFSCSSSATAEQRPKAPFRGTGTSVVTLPEWCQFLRGHLYGTRFDLVAGRHSPAGYSPLVPAWRSVAPPPARRSTPLQRRIVNERS
jgi:hypothetical protein